jgi:hypothetical protein
MCASGNCSGNMGGLKKGTCKDGPLTQFCALK